MNKTKSKIYFVVLTTLLVGGFPNFMAQEAFAVSATFATLHTGDTAGDSTATTTLDLVFNQKVYVDDGAGGNADGASTDIQTHLSLNGGAAGAGIASAIVLEEEGDSGVVNGFPTTGDCGAAAATVVITLDTALATDATPTIAYTNPGAVATQVLTCDDLGSAVASFAAQTATDGLSPALSSASVTSTTTIDVTFSEDLDAATIVAADFTVTNPTTTIASVSEDSAGVVTLTLSSALSDSDTPTVTVTNAATGIDDTSATDNTISSGNVVASSGFTNGKNGSGCSDCEPPTLGVNSDSKRIVENGFTYNGKPADAERFFTPYPLITATVGKQNTAEFRIYEDKGPENIKHFSFAFGLDKGQYIGESKAMIELDIDHDGTETVTVTDPENALDNVKVSTNVANCNGDNSNTQCLIVTIDHRFRAPLDFNIVGTDVWDMNRNSWQNYFNHGIEVTGESLNPAKEYSGINAGHIYHLTETSKTTAIDEFGNTWSFQYGLWMKDYVKNIRVSDSTSISDRLHPNFADYKALQIQKAIITLLESCSTCLTSYDDFDDSFGHSYPDTINKLDDSEILQKMILESEKAQVIMNYLLDPVSYRN